MTPARGVLARTPIRVQLVVALVVLVTVGLLATGVVVTTAIRGYLVGQVDRDLIDLADEPPRADMFGSRAEHNPFETRRDEYIGLAGLSGRIPEGFQTTSNADTAPPDLERTDITQARPGQPFSVPSQAEGSRWRVLVQPATLNNGNRILVVRGVSLADVQAATRRLVLVELLVGTATLALLGAVAYLLVRTSLRPLEEVESTAAAIAAGDLSRRVPEGDRRTEVGRLSGALNGMLAQIETAFRARERSEALARQSEDRMRRFVADASHELRTPLTSIRGYAELFRHGAVTEAGGVQRLVRRIEDEAARMGLLVEDLLLLARLDQQRPLQQAPVDLLDVVSDVAADARMLAPDRSVDLDVTGDQPPVVLGDEPRLRQVMTNLVSNALTHTPDGTPVTITIETIGPATGAPGWVRLGVRDAGPGLSPDERERVFERFYRADRARTRAAGGTGLGLSIVAALVAAHGGRVGVESQPGQGSIFTVDLPLYDGQPALDRPSPPPGAGWGPSRDSAVGRSAGE